LAPCLDALACQTLGVDRFEVIVVNDGSFHDLEPLAEKIRGAKQLRLRIENIAQGGPGAARNHGARLAKAPALAFTDDDCVPEPDWLEALARELPRSPAALLGGPVGNLLPNRPGSEASQVLIDFLYHYYNADFEDARFFTSNNMATSREIFLRHGGFNAEFHLNAGEDRDLCARWREHGGKLVFVASARIGHAHDLSLARFWRQHLRYGHGAAGYWLARRQPALRVEPAGFYLKLLAYPFQALSPMRALRASLLLAVAQLANALGFIAALRQLDRAAAQKLLPPPC
jgi:GT2 family glycosyltransferase